MAKCEEEVILVVKCSAGEKEAVLDVTGKQYWPVELDVKQWFEDFNDYASTDGALWLAASGVTKAIRSRIPIMREEPESVLFR